MLDRADGESLRSGFVRHVQSAFNSPALVIGDITRSYGELGATASRWANAITRALCSRPQRVGIFAYRSETAYAGTLAALYAGATYVPLNPTFPAGKTAGMAAAADLDSVIVDAACLPQVREVFGESNDILVVTPDFEAAQVTGIPKVLDRTMLAETGPIESLPPLTPEDSAYLLFTSGSTGLPKGVPVTHGNVVAFIDYMSRRYGIRSDDRFSQTFDQTFDLSVFDLFMAWHNGACVCAMSPVDLIAPTKFINRRQLTVWFSVPSTAAHMLRRHSLKANTLPTLRWSLFCGEPLTQRCAEAWQEAAPNSVLENLYGPTELTIACLVHRWDAIRSPLLCRNGIVPIGRPYDGLIATVLDEKLSPVAAGNTGELCVSGPQTTPGYWRAPELTEQRYVNLAISRHETRRFYRTGDLVARGPEGEYIFLGRADQQIKILGHRIELGEVEAALRGDLGVEHAVALAWPPPPAGAEYIMAFVSGNIASTEHLTSLVKASLPPYAIPRRIFVTEEMPLNPNGKVDRGALKKRLQDEMTQPDQLDA